jgi:hypothetical protein
VTVRYLLLLALVAVPAEAAAQARLFPYTATYATTARDFDQEKDIGARRITVSDTTIGGQHAWVVAQTTEITHDPLRDPTDSVVMSADLQPISRRTKLGATRFVLDVRGDSVVGWKTADGGRQTLSVPVAEGAFLNSWAEFAAFPMLPLAAGWKGRAAVLYMGDVPSFTPVTLEVMGENRVTVPAGTFDCWVVDLAYASGPHELLWISRDRHLLVQDAGGTGDGTIITMKLSSLSLPDAP